MRWLCAFLWLIACCRGEPENSTEAGVEDSLEAGLWPLLTHPENRYYVMMRHALAPGRGDPDEHAVGHCASQRNLDDEGRTQARKTGAMFRRQNVTFDEIVSSQWCRCFETAQLMRLGSVCELPSLNSFYDAPGQADLLVDGAIAFMKDPARLRSPGVTMMVTHQVTIARVIRKTMASGQMIVVKVDENGELEEVGLIDAVASAASLTINVALYAILLAGTVCAMDFQAWR